MASEEALDGNRLRIISAGLGSQIPKAFLLQQAHIHTHPPEEAHGLCTPAALLEFTSRCCSEH